jgi:hypothetical protein
VYLTGHDVAADFHFRALGFVGKRDRAVVKPGPHSFPLRSLIEDSPLPFCPSAPLQAYVVPLPEVNEEPPSGQCESPSLSAALVTLTPSLPLLPFVPLVPSVPFVPGSPFSPLSPLSPLSPFARCRRR